ncbi:urease accessory protein UreD [Actinocorallia longicatena]|uniref:Urease accessory protein UreD n=1 Tax=Actinocorallia longicatena TaxID=111803 RepID=A0ABP6QK66_9ACTN
MTVADTRVFTAHAAVTAEPGPHGRTRLTRLRSDGPIALRETPDGLYIVGAGAGPLGGDRLRLDIVVGAGASLRIRSVAAALALPGTAGEESLFTIDARVRGHLDFAPEPTVAARGCLHRAVSEVRLGPDATLRWSEELVLGRYGEEPGRHVSRLDVTRGDRPVLRHELRLDGSARSRAVLGDARAAGAVVRIGPGLTGTALGGEGFGVMPLAAEGVLVTALAADSAELRRRLEKGEQVLTGQ